MSKTKLRDPVEIINSASHLKLKADPTRAMVDIAVAAERCLRYYPTLASPSWHAAIRTIREALEDIEDIYDSSEESQ